MSVRIQQVRNRTFREIFLASFALMAALALFSCGGGGVDMAGGGIGGTGKSVGAITAKGSIFVNGVEFDTGNAEITLDDTTLPVGDDSSLQIGMVAKVKGIFNDDGMTGEAEKIEVENEVQGTIAQILSADSFTVNGQEVITDGKTILDPPSFTPAQNDPVEVHGQRDSSGIIRATRVERIEADPVDEVKGFVSGFTDTSAPFTLINGAASITVVLEFGFTSNGSIADGLLVELHGTFDGASNTFTADTVDIEDIEDEAFDFREGDEFEVEGFVTEFSVHPGTFRVNGEPVQTTPSTRFEGGVPEDLADNVKVEAEGDVISGGVLLADKIEFKDAIRIESNVEDKGSDDVTLLGITVRITSQTEVNVSGGFGAINAGDGLKVRGFVNMDNTSITATRIDEINPVDPDRHIYQALVTDTAPPVLTLAGGITVDTTGAEFRDDDDSTLTSSGFFGLVIINRTVVKARGSFSGGVIFNDPGNPGLRVEIE